MDNTAKQNIVDLNKEKSLRELQILKDTEEKLIKQAMEDKNKFNNYNGYKDPREDEALSKGLKDTFREKKTRRFIIAYKKINPAKLGKNNQPRDEIAIKNYCEQDLIPRIQKTGLEFIPFVEKVDELNSGYNRTWCLEKMYDGEDIDVFELSDPYFINDDGTLQVLNDKTKRYFERRARSRTNPFHAHQSMNMASIALEIEALYSEDPTFVGLNPSGEKFKSAKCVFFNQVVDTEFPGYFTHSVARGKIFAMLWDKTSANKAKIKPLQESDKTGALKKLGWEDGVDSKGKRKPFGSHICENNSAYIGMTNTNGNNFESVISNKVVDLFCAKELEENLKHIFLFCEVYKPDKTVTNLKQQRKAFLAKIKKYNNMAEILTLKESEGTDPTMPFVKKVYFPPQLSSPADKGELFIYDETEKTFKLQVNKK